MYGCIISAESIGAIAHRTIPLWPTGVDLQTHQQLYSPNQDMLVSCHLGIVPEQMSIDMHTILQGMELHDE
jgi:hypothetical protein